MKDFAKKFYLSKEWRRTRDYIIKRNFGLCEICNRNPATEVHHIIHLTPENIHDTNITLGEDNLIALCHTDHMRQHATDTPIVTFDEDGNIDNVYEDYMQDDTNPYNILDEILSDNNETNTINK